MVYQVTKDINTLDEKITEALMNKKGRVNLLKVRDKLIRDTSVQDAMENIQRSYQIAEMVKEVVKKTLVDIAYDHIFYRSSTLIREDKFSEIVAVCPNEHPPNVTKIAAKGLFDSKTPTQEVKWTKSNLIYIKDKSTIDNTIIDNGNLLCNICSKKHKVITRKFKRGDISIYRKAYNPNFMFGNVIKALRNELNNHEIPSKEQSKLTERLIDDSINRSAELGFESFNSFLEKSQLSRISYFGLPKQIRTALTKVRNEYIPPMDMFIRNRSKLTIAEKYILTHYLDKNQRTMDDFIGFRMILPKTSDCYNFYHSVKNSDVFNVNKEVDYINRPKKGTGYQSIHLKLLVNTDFLIKEIGTIVDYDDHFIKTWFNDCKIELQIRTNWMDNNAETDSRQKHEHYKVKQKELIDKTLLANRIYNKAYLMRSILNPENIINGHHI